MRSSQPIVGAYNATMAAIIFKRLIAMILTGCFHGICDDNDFDKFDDFHGWVEHPAEANQWLAHVSPQHSYDDDAHCTC